LVEGAHKGEGLGNQFLSHIREVDAVVYVLRAFENANIVNVNSTIDPWRDKEILDMELILKDIETIDKLVSRLQKDSRSGDKEIIKELAVIEKVKKFLDGGLVLSEQEFDEPEKIILKQYQLLSMKPRLYLLNGEMRSSTSLKEVELLKDATLTMDIAAEAEAESFSPEERESLGLARESQLDVLIKKSYELLGLITFLTTGADETRAWTITQGMKAPQAGGVIHTDFEKTFVKAEVVNWKDLLDTGGFAKARERGLIRTEGKEYIVKDGDVVEIKHG
jgi:hypothetical protein